MVADLLLQRDAEHRAGLGVQRPHLAFGGAQYRWRMARGGPGEGGLVRVDAGDDRGGVEVEAQSVQELVQPCQEVPGAAAVDGVGAQGGAQLAHHHGGVQPVPGDVSDHGDEAAVGLAEGVVPVTADVQATGGREIARRQAQARCGGQLGEQGALQRLGDVPVVLEAPGVLQGDAGPPGQFDQHDGIVRVPALVGRREREDALGRPAREQGDAQQGPAGVEGRGRLVVDAGQIAGVVGGVLGASAARRDDGGGRMRTAASCLVHAVEQPDVDGARVPRHQQCGQQPHDGLVVERSRQGRAGVGQEGQPAAGVLRLLAGLLLGGEQLALGAPGGVQLGVQSQYALVGLVQFLAVEGDQGLLLVEPLQQLCRVLVGAEQGFGQRRRVVVGVFVAGDVGVLGAGDGHPPHGPAVLRPVLHRCHLDAELASRR